MSVPPPPPARPPDPPPDPSAARRQALRDTVLFLAGLALAGHEVVVVPELRWEVLVLAAAMMGLPAVFRLPTDPPP